MTNQFHPGQRWVSESEPELGLGSVLGVSDRTVTIAFGASDEQREYAADNAPLRRVRFRIGDSVTSRDGGNLTVQSISEQDGLVIYEGERRQVCETELSDTIRVNKPEERLLAGLIDSPEAFQLRVAALEHQYRRRKSQVRGFAGGRIDLIPHQLYIASEVAERPAPRVLLADEVGLGKTIEACLILHRLLLTGRAQRVLILVPDSLVHQWFVELLRRFNLWFHIFDEERCAAIQANDPDANPFLDDQLVLCRIGLFAGKKSRLAQATAAGWDVLVVDEAHHLGWSPEFVSPEYAVVEVLGRRIPGLLLLTATPEQLGVASHFARLRLLDPDRFFDLSTLQSETERYGDVARLAKRLLDNRKLSATDARVLTDVLSEPKEHVRSVVKQINSGDQSVRDELIQKLLDQHGTGRVMFRNTRATISGFPKRSARIQPLDAPADKPGLFDALANEFAADTDANAATAFEPDLENDPRVEWLADLLRTLVQEKVLLICRTQRKAEAIEAALRKRINVRMATFHEGLPLVQRDRNAAWFADEDGARILICSEIGSEGRNFQFVRHLVLFDLPLDPELVEQRIGRLDRIGQSSEIQVYLPFVTSSALEVLVRWYHEGLNSFEKNLHGGHELLERFRARVHDLALDFHETKETSRAELRKLVEETRAATEELAARLEQGKDRLLELNSFRPERASRLIQDIRGQDGDESLDEFMLAVFDRYSIQVEELAQRTYQLGSAGVFADVFPGLPTEGLTVTCARPRALAREDIQFLTWDHPLVTGALDLLLGSEQGNSSFALWPDTGTVGLYLEAFFVIECLAPSHLHADRFLPPTPMRVLLDHRGHDVGESISADMFASHLRSGGVFTLMDRPEIREELLPKLLRSAEGIAKGQSEQRVAEARHAMNAQLEHEITRLKELRKVNPSVRGEEIELIVRQQSELDQRLTDARLRLDAVRLIQRGPC